MVDSASNSTLDPKKLAEALSPKEDHALGAVVGAFIGDSLGSYCEFQALVSEEEALKALTMPGGGPFLLSPGQVTDDSELALCLAHGISLGDGILSLDRISYYYRKWIMSKPFDIGNTTKTALGKLGYVKSDVPIEKSNGWAQICKNQTNAFNYNSQSNGGLMRITPLAVYCMNLESDEDVTKAVKAEQGITHCNEVALDAAVGYVLAIRYLINNNGESKGLDEKIGEWVKTTNSDIGKFWQEYLDGEIPPGTPQMGWLKKAWIYSFYSIGKGFTFKQAMHKILLKGGDTDTNCAIVGGMVGAKLGFKKLLQDESLMVEKFFNVDMATTIRDEFWKPSNVVPLVLNICKIAPKTLKLAENFKEEESLKK